MTVANTMSSLKKIKYPKLEPVHGSIGCAYSVIENKLKTLYENQEKIYALLVMLIEQKSQND